MCRFFEELSNEIGWLSNSICSILYNTHQWKVETHVEVVTAFIVLIFFPISLGSFISVPIHFSLSASTWSSFSHHWRNYSICNEIRNAVKNESLIIFVWKSYQISLKLFRGVLCRVKCPFACAMRVNLDQSEHLPFVLSFSIIIGCIFVYALRSLNARAWSSSAKIAQYSHFNLLF